MIKTDIIIPDTVLHDNKLSLLARLLYGEIFTYCNFNCGKCDKTNRYYANLYGKTKETISRVISELIVANYIQTEIIRNDKNEIIKRIIKIV